ncbi:MAG TPA: hypothetical protein VJ972_15470 [Anaerolineales bacterium]|nr:hypothetical protein [Anaerolineales bacterium]
MKKIFLYFLLILIGFLASCSIFEEKLPTINRQNAEEIITKTQMDITPIDLTNTPDPTREWKNEEIEYGKERVFILVDVLEDYYIDHLEYPTSLDDLISGYISSIPRTIYGDQISYILEDSGFYLLYYDLERSGSEEWTIRCGYISRIEVWECSGGTP